jgi:Holliday junction resolvasome RuvABC endonuclease subunit
MTTLLAFDPSIRACGWFALDVDTWTAIEAGAIETIATASSNDWAIERVLADASDGWTICSGVARIVRRLEPAAIAMEAPQGAQDARAAALLARANQAVYDGIRSAAPHIRPLFVSAHAAKWAATGAKRPKGGKAEVREAVSARFGRARMAELSAKAKSPAGIEGIYDAGAVALLAMRLPQVKALRAQNELPLSAG